MLAIIIQVDFQDVEPGFIIQPHKEILGQVKLQQLLVVCKCHMKEFHEVLVLVVFHGPIATHNIILDS